MKDEVTHDKKERGKKHNSFSVEEKGMNCDHNEAQVMAMQMKKLMHKCDAKFALVQQHLHHKGMKIFGKKGKEATAKELKQQHARKCFALMAIEALLKMERDGAQQALMH